MNLIKFLLASVLIGAGLTACTTLQIQMVEATPAPAALAVPPADTATAAATAVAKLADSPTATHTATATDTPAPTDTPLPTATLKSTPTVVRTPTHTPEPTAKPTTATVTDNTSYIYGNSDLVLKPTELPAGFQPLDLVKMGLTKESLSSSPFTVESAFAFVQSETSEVVLGGTVGLSGGFQKIGFDVMLNSPQLVTNMALSNMKNVKIVEQSALSVQKVGDNSAGFTTVVDVNGQVMRADVVGFRKGNFGAFVASVYPKDEKSAVAIGDLAQKLADKIQ